MPTETKNKQYSIARLDAGRLKDLEQLYTAVYNKPPAVNYFQKKYDTAYTGVMYTGYVAYNSVHVPIAYYGVMPCFIEYGNEKILAAQSGDTMTDPHFRYQGMFVELSKITFELCRQSGIRFIFGFPNQHSYHGAIHKLGWIMTEQLECFTITVNTIPLASLANRFPWLKRLYHAYAGYILGRYILPVQGIANSVVAAGYAGVCRDENYLQYKTYSNTVVVRAGNAKAWISTCTNMVIGDLHVEEADFATTIQVLKKIAARLGIRQVFFHSSPGTRLQQLFSPHYPAIPSFPVLFQDFDSGLSFAHIKFTFADIDIF